MTTTLTLDQIRDAVETHNRLREQCLAYLKDNPEVLGDDAWLRAAITEGDITLTVGETGIEGYGSTWSSQTVGSEWFTFTIPFEALSASDSGDAGPGSAGKTACRIVGPYLPLGDVDWTCRTHDVEALPRAGVTLDGQLRRADLRCPVSEPLPTDGDRLSTPAWESAVAPQGARGERTRIQPPTRPRKGA